MDRPGEHAVVLGAGMGGLFTARVLADHFRRVTVVERDTDGTRGPRRGIPQGHHPHGLLLQAADLFDSFFPGVVGECAGDGAVRATVLTQHRVYLYGHLLRQTPIGRETVLASRPLLENRIAERVRALPNVTVRRGWEAAGLLGSGERVSGVAVTRAGTGSREELDADLVVDATGRSGRAMAWLRGFGLPEPAEQRFRVDVTYATRICRLPRDVLGTDRLVTVGPEPSRPRGLALVARENDQWSLTVYGYGAHRPPADPDGFTAAVEELVPEDVAKALARVEEAGPVQVMRFPASVRRRYDRLRRFPEGLLVLGDALCSLNPVYGTGMTNAAVQARVLDHCLRRVGPGGEGLWRAFFREAGRAVAPAWWFASTGDVPLTGKSGPPGVRLGGMWLRRVARAASADPDVSAALMRVIGMDRPPTSLLRPGMAARVLRAG
jgi:2-polyprenyl-6-methoxyphenol hydroxylase-like FAD-dependent oxidoreductase